MALTGLAYAGDMPQPTAASSETVVQGAIGQPLTEVIMALLESTLSLI